MLLLAGTAQFASAQAPSEAEIKTAKAKKQAALSEAFDRGTKALAAKQYETAIESLSLAGQIDPAQDAVWGSLGDAYSRLAATKTGSDRTILNQKGVECYRRAIDLKPDEPAYLNNYATSLASISQFVDARAALAKAIRIDPKNADRYSFNLGAILYNSQQDQAALDAFSSIAATSPFYERAQSQIQKILIDNPRFRSMDYLKDPAFRSTLNTYIAGSMNWFQDLKGKELYKNSDMGVWELNLSLPGSNGCTVGWTQEAQLVCILAAARSKDPLLAEYRQVISRVAAALGAGWTPAEIQPGSADEPSQCFSGQKGEVYVHIVRENNLYKLGISIVAHQSAPGAPKR